MFGMHCRKTKIAVVYAIRDKCMKTLSDILKKHVDAGSMILSDSHMSYTNINKGVSHLTQYGFCHMWTNHAIRMVHEKFPFNHTLNVERVWSNIKRTCYLMKRELNFDVIQEYCDAYLMRKCIVKKQKIYEFMMRSIHDWYVAMHKRYLTSRNYEEFEVPSILDIDEMIVNTSRKSKSNRWVGSSRMIGNFDMDLLSKTSEEKFDFDKNFMKYLNIAREKIDKLGARERCLTENTQDLHNKMLKYGLKIGTQTKNTNYLPVWP